MSRDDFAVSRGAIGARPVGLMATSVSRKTDDEPARARFLSILAMASSIRLEDPRLEHERVVVLEVAILEGREVARGLDEWLSQSLAEYRGSRSAWDLKETTAELCIRLDRYDQTLRETADRLVALIPGLVAETPGVTLTATSKRGGRLLLDEIAAASGLVAAIRPRPPDPAEAVGNGGG